MALESGESPTPIRLMVVDDHPAVRAGLALLVSSDAFEICAEAGSRSEAAIEAERCRPDLAIVDLSLDGEDGLPVIGDLHARGVRVMVYSMHGDVEHIRRAFAAGALGYVSKSETRAVLLDGIRQVASGRRFVCPRAALALADPAEEVSRVDPRGLLSAKELEVFRLLGRGEGTTEIAEGMAISTHTVESYYTRIQQKLDVHGMYELRHRAIEYLRRHGD